MIKKHAWKIATVSLGLTVALFTTAGSCEGKFSEPFNDAPRSGVENGKAADVVTFPDGFSNYATKCDHGHRIYSAYHGDNPYAAGFVVPNDPTCK